ncbi:hypothetical protein K491DRAFT_709987 [Lophiostoma macrostomum CBS 122681]|uniref:Uncharacterized protein n=1 Tax=Lophiostoma macrostomum CBS 122681 TaxID=1314788 RepID=A0A6A6TUJ6_9PLEO|nr:hypothetical protein K491DRAFT_709987 [Lophiostoma macrostomum CBS 122681]
MGDTWEGRSRSYYNELQDNRPISGQTALGFDLRDASSRVEPWVTQRIHSDDLRSWNTTPLNDPRRDLPVPFNNQCNDSDGKNFCDCQIGSSHRSHVDRCMYYGHHVEPLAWSIDPGSVNPQENSSLFARFPPEIRDTIYEYALTDCTSNPFNTDKPARRPMYSSNPFRGLPSTDIAFPLLQSCKAVYLHAFKIPLLSNPFNIYRFGSLPSYDTTRPRFLNLAPWQFALIHRLDISVQQTNLEGGYLATYLDTWRAAERHSRYVVAPRFYQETRKTYPGPVMQSFCFGLLSVTPNEDAIPVTLPTKSSNYPTTAIRGENRSPFSVTQTARAMVARPMTHLTLRLSRTDWWTWTDTPSAPTVDHLGLDPALGDGRGREHERPAHLRMMNLAAERRAGQWPNPWGQHPPPTAYTGTWGASIAKLPDLKVLELILETFGTKKAQLDTVIECAKTWRFPLDGGKWELIWDGKVEDASYQHAVPGQQRYTSMSTDLEEALYGLDDSELESNDEDSDQNWIANQSWITEDSTVVVRIIRFRRARIH